MTMTRRAMLGALAASGAATMLRAAPAIPEPLPKQLAPAAMRADLALIADAYGQLHPGLGRYLPQGGFDALVAEASAWARRARTPAEFYVALSRLTAQVRCGHTFPNPANQSRRVQQRLLGRADRLPLCTAWIDGEMVVTDPLASSLARGDRIEAIDGIAAGRMLRDMLPLTRADGSNDAKRVAQLELHRGDRFAAFDVLRPLLYRTRPGEAVLQVRGERGTRTIAVATAAEGQRGVAAADDPQFGWRFAIGADGVGLLTMPDWALYQSKWDWRGFIDAAVDALIDGKARGLIVDVRENEGGLDCGDPLLARLVERPIAEAGARRLVRFRETPEALRPQLDTWDRSFDRLGVDAVPAPDRPGFYDIGAAETRRIVPDKRRYAGPVAVLVSATCSSATFGFARLVRESGAGTLVGTPTGGNLRGINGGAYFFLRLPATGFEVDLPLIGYFPDTPQPDAGLVPDVLAPTTLASVRRGEDPGMIAARRVIAARG